MGSQASKKKDPSLLTELSFLLSENIWILNLIMLIFTGQYNIIIK